MSVAQVRKAIVAGVSAASILAVSALEVGAEWISEDVSAWVSGAIAVVGAIGVYLVRNAPIIDKIGTGEIVNPPPTPPAAGS